MLAGNDVEGAGASSIELESTATARLREIDGVDGAFAEAEADLKAGRVDAGMRRVVSILAELRRALPKEQWRAICGSAALQPVRSILHQDPHVLRAHAKPRRYAGDAVLLDYIYGCAPLPDRTTQLGRAIYLWAVENSPAFRSVRLRRWILAQHLNATAAKRPNSRVLALACGHLREVQLSAAVVGGALSELVAMDQDPLSLDVVRCNCIGLPVRCLQATVGDVLKGRLDTGEFDLIYAAGLYDYLPDAIARPLTAALASRLAPGGELLIANFQHFRDAGYMEAIMDWFLLYRTEADLLSLVRDVRNSHVRTWTDSEDVVAYLSLTRC
jgi:hypothetical protein